MAETPRKWIYAAGLAALGVASRLPQLRGPNLLIDGDESVLGLMAKHFSQGKELPLFFYGQHYALATVEAGAAALSFRIFGVGALPLKAAMLALWIAGVLLLFLVQSRFLGTRMSFWVAAVLMLSPAWAVWSMRAGGGYLTAFTASAMMIWLLTPERDGAVAVRWTLAGVLTAFVYLAQPLWLPGVMPILGVLLVRQRRLLPPVVFLFVTMAAILAVKLATPDTPVAWHGPEIGNPSLVASLPLIAQQLYVHLTGSHYLTMAIEPPGPATKILAVIWCGLFAAAALLQVYRLVTRRYLGLSHLLFACICSTLAAEWVLLAARDARYLLPLTALLVPLVGIELLDLVDGRRALRTAAVAATCVVLALGALSLREFGDFNYLWTNPPQRWTEARRLQQVFGYLKVKDVSHVFSMNGMLDSQLVFYSNEQVVSRWADPLGRYPAYVKAVDHALVIGEPVAVVGYTNGSGAPGCWDVPICTGGVERLVANPESIFTVDGKYFVYVGADRALLEKLGFRFWNE